MPSWPRRDVRSPDADRRAHRGQGPPQGAAGGHVVRVRPQQRGKFVAAISVLGVIILITTQPSGQGIEGDRSKVENGGHGDEHADQQADPADGLTGAAILDEGPHGRERDHAADRVPGVCG